MFVLGHPVFRGSFNTFVGLLLPGSKKCFIQRVACIAGRTSGQVLLSFRGGAMRRFGATQNNIDCLSQLHHQESTPHITILPAMQAKISATELFFGNKRHKFVKTVVR